MSEESDVVLVDLSEVERPWDPLPEEKSIWHERFLRYLMLGPLRTLQGAYAWSQAENGRGITRYGSSWQKMSKRWLWEERAAEYDKKQDNEWLTEFEERKVAARRRRLTMLDEVLQDSFLALVKADLPTMKRAEIISNLGQVRGIFESAMKMERLEYGEATEIGKDEQLTLFDLSDDLKHAIDKTYGLAPSGEDEEVEEEPSAVGLGPLFEGGA